MTMYRNALLLLLAIFLALPALAAADVAIIVNKDNPNPVTEQFAQKAFLGSVARWPSRAGITVVDLPEQHPATQLLYARLLHKTTSEVRDIWGQNYFTGRSAMPKEVPSDAEAKRLVAGNKNAIGYIDAGAVDSSVKVVLTIR
jgi:ABC-type phosphate transport system substrate-binding protein